MSSQIYSLENINSVYTCHFGNKSQWSCCLQKRKMLQNSLSALFSTLNTSVVTIFWVHSFIVNKLSQHLEQRIIFWMSPGTRLQNTILDITTFTSFHLFKRIQVVKTLTSFTRFNQCHRCVLLKAQCQGYMIQVLLIFYGAKTYRKSMKVWHGARRRGRKCNRFQWKFDLNKQLGLQYNKVKPTLWGWNGRTLGLSSLPLT